jgi:hypothetical protein
MAVSSKVSRTKEQKKRIDLTDLFVYSVILIGIVLALSILVKFYTY